MTNASIDPELRRQAREALQCYGVKPSRMTCLAHRHNYVFRVDTESGERYVLRIQNNLLTDAQASSQLTWLVALAEQTTLCVPVPVRTLSNDSFVRIETPLG